MWVAWTPLNEDIDQVDQLTGLERNKQGGQNLQASGIKRSTSAGNGECCSHSAASTFYW